MKTQKLRCTFLLAILTSACATGNDLREPERESLLRSQVWKMENPQCSVKGNTANWQAAYCMWMNKTNEYETDEVQECYKTLTTHAGIPKTLCERNQYFKKEICKTLVLEQTFPGSLSDCLASDESVPRVVRDGLQ